MAHKVGKDVYRELGNKIDGLSFRAPWNATLRAILKELYSEDEADLIVRMPFGLSTLQRLERTTGYPQARLEPMLEQLARKGLVMDLHVGGKWHFMVSPLIIGIFEFTMMRSGGLDAGKLARLFHDYLEADDLWRANAGSGQHLQIMRALPHEEAVHEASKVEVLDYEKATAIVESHTKFAISLCACRHEKLHVGKKKCDVPLESCTSMGTSAGFLIRRGLAREASKSEMLEQLARSKEARLVLNADNVRNKVGFICHCCSCCCNMLLGISRTGYPNLVVTSSFIAEVDAATCEGCGKCYKNCPIGAVRLEPVTGADGRKKARAEVDGRFCIGCGVCALDCSSGALSLRKREARVLHPEDTFERIVLQCLEAGTLQNQLFDDPHRITHRFMRAFVGGVLNLPAVKKALVGDTLRSRFIAALKPGRKGATAAEAGS
jgi:ferredoxin